MKNLMLNNKKGITLIEILVVVVIISTLLGITGAFFTHFNRKMILKSSLYKIGIMISSAKNYSLRENSPTVLEINKKENKIDVYGYRTRGFWHLEEKKTKGAFNLDANATSSSLVDGKIGKCLKFKGLGNINCGYFSKYDLNKGLKIGFWIYLEKPMTIEDEILFEIGRYYKMGIRNNNYLFIYVNEEKIIVDNVYLDYYKWNYIEFLNNGKLIIINVNSIPKFIRPSPGFLDIPKDEILYFAKNFYGKIDHIKISEFANLENYSLPEKVIIKSSPDAIYFTEESILDGSKHISTPEIILEAEVLNEKLEAKLQTSFSGLVTFDF